MDNYTWHRCCELCRSLDLDNPYYKYLHQDVCLLRQSNWMLKISRDIADLGAAVITGREEPFNLYKEKLSVMAKISTSDKLEKISLELNNRSDIKQLVLEINSYLRNLVIKHKEIFYSCGQFSHCSFQVLSFNDRVREIKYYMIHVVFHIQMKGKPQESHQWWISCCNPQTMEIGKKTMKMQCDFIIDEYFQGLVGDKHLMADGLGKQWKFYLIKELATEEEKVQQAEEVEQLPKVGQVLQPMSPISTTGASDGEDTEDEKDREPQDLQEAS